MASFSRLLGERLIASSPWNLKIFDFKLQNNLSRNKHRAYFHKLSLSAVVGAGRLDVSASRLPVGQGIGYLFESLWGCGAELISGEIGAVSQTHPISSGGRCNVWAAVYLSRAAPGACLVLLSGLERRLYTSQELKGLLIGEALI